jgi:hypothetical protein
VLTEFRFILSWIPFPLPIPFPKAADFDNQDLKMGAGAEMETAPTSIWFRLSMSANDSCLRG